MPTEKPKVSAYVSDAVYQALIDYQQRNALPSVSSAAGEVLSKFLLQGGPSVDHGAIATLEEKVRKLEEEVHHISQRLAVSPDRLPPQKARVMSPDSIHPNAGNKGMSEPRVVHSQELSNGLSQNKLCDLAGISSKHVARAAKSRGMSSQQFLEEKTGWIFTDGRYYPPS